MAHDWVKAEHNGAGAISDWSNSDGENVCMANANSENDGRELTDTNNNEILLRTMDNNDDCNRNTHKDFLALCTRTTQAQ